MSPHSRNFLNVNFKQQSRQQLDLDAMQSDAKRESLEELVALRDRLREATREQERKNARLEEAALRTWVGQAKNTKKR